MAIYVLEAGPGMLLQMGNVRCESCEETIVFVEKSAVLAYATYEAALSARSELAYHGASIVEYKGPGE